MTIFIRWYRRVLCSLFRHRFRCDFPEGIGGFVGQVTLTCSRCGERRQRLFVRNWGQGHGFFLGKE